MKTSASPWVGLAVLLIVLGSYIFFWAEAPWSDRIKTKSSPTAQPVPIVVAAVERKAVPVILRSVGNARARASVAIKSRVDGQLMAVHFKDGQTVREGDLLYTIDPRPFQMQLAQATAVLSRDRAQLENARVDLKRTLELKSKGYSAEQQLDLARTTVVALEDTVKTDEAAIGAIRLQIDYSEIRAPFDGRAADTQVDAGNLIKANDVPLVIINQTKPINVAFSVPEQFAFEIRQRMAKEKLEVEVNAPAARAAAQKGVVTFIDNAIDSDTGTVLVEATLTNDDESLLPGQFVTVALRLETIPDALVIPSQAVQTGQQGEYVFVLKPDDTVELRRIVVGETTGTGIVVRSGLEAGDQIVIDGQLRLLPGVRAAPTRGTKATKTEASG